MVNKNGIFYPYLYCSSRPCWCSNTLLKIKIAIPEADVVIFLQHPRHELCGRMPFADTLKSPIPLQ